MKTQLNRMMKDERGITALETAIILIAFVVVAAIFAFTVLTTGTFLTEQSKQASYAGLQQVSSSMQLEGSIVLQSTGTYVVFNLATVAGGSSQDLSKVIMTYRDTTVNQVVSGPTSPCSTTTDPASGWSWNVTLPSATALTNCILSAGSIGKITVDLGGTTITANQQFALELTPATGGVLLLQRTAPAQISQVTDLH